MIFTHEHDDVRWLKPWSPVPPNASLVTELQKEVGPQHVLFERAAISIARREDTDDVLFYLPTGPAAYATVHLTWRGAPEGNGWPQTRLYESFAAWAQDQMLPDHEGYLANH